MTRSSASPTRSLIAVVIIGGGAALPLFLLGGFSFQIKDDLALSNTQFGALITMFMLTAAIATHPARDVVERGRTSVALRVSATVTGLSMLVTAWFATSWIPLMLMIGVAGPAMAISEPAGTMLTVQSVKREHLGFAFGVRQAAFPAGQSITGLVVALVAGWSLGWRSIFVVGALLMLASIALVPDSRHRVHDLPAEHTAPYARRPLLLLGLATGLGSSTGAAFSGFLVVSTLDLGMTPAGAGLLLAVSTAAGILTRFLLGAIADRGLHPPAVAAGAAMLGIVGHLLLAQGDPGLAMIGAPIAIGFGWGWVGVVHLIAVGSLRQRPATATSFVQTGNYLGAVIGPLVFGIIADRAGYSAAWTVTAASLGAASAVLLLGRKSWQPSVSMLPVQ